MEKTMKNLGCMNGWAARVWTKADGSKFVEKEDTTPQEFKVCTFAGHFDKIIRVKLGNCHYENTCPICKIKYTVDSSD